MDVMDPGKTDTCATGHVSGYGSGSGDDAIGAGGKKVTVDARADIGAAEPSRVGEAYCVGKDLDWFVQGRKAGRWWCSRCGFLVRDRTWN